MIPCKSVAELITSDRLKDAGFWMRTQVRVHLWMCRHCTRLARQMAQLRAAASQLAHAFDDESAGELEDRLLKKINAPRP